MTSFVNISCLHLKLFTFDRLIAIKFTMHYSNVNSNKPEISCVFVAWITAILSGIFLLLKLFPVYYSIVSLVFRLCIVFIAFAYILLYHEPGASKGR